jgi:signal transduction histidine kinase
VDARGAAALFLWLVVSSATTPALLLGATLVTWPLGWRCRRPWLVYGLVLAGVMIGSGLDPWGRLLALAIAAYTLGASRSAWLLTLAAIVVPATFALIVFGGQIPPLSRFVGPYVVLGVPWLAGYAIAQQRRRAEASQDKAARLEQEQALATQAALADERARIARELHDVVAHHVSVMVIQAGAARQVLETAPEQAKTALQTVEATGREALSEMRHMVGLLSPDGSQLGLAPQPGVLQLEALVQRVSEAGLPVVLRVEGQAHTLPAGVDLAAYRIIQEALTNALTHASQAKTEVVLRYGATGLAVEVLDEGREAAGATGRSTGHGLVSMRERTALYGGTFEAGPRPDHGYGLKAWLPYAAQ